MSLNEINCLGKGKAKLVERKERKVCWHFFLMCEWYILPSKRRGPARFDGGKKTGRTGEKRLLNYSFTGSYLYPICCVQLVSFLVGES